MIKQVFMVSAGFLFLGSVALAAEPVKHEWSTVSPSDFKAESRAALDKWVSNFAGLGNYEVWSATSRELHGKPYVGQSVLRMEASRPGRFLFAWYAPWRQKDVQFSMFDGKKAYRGSVRFGESTVVDKYETRTIPTVNGDAGRSTEGFRDWDALTENLDSDDRYISIVGAWIPVYRPDSLCASVDPIVRSGFPYLGKMLFEAMGNTAHISPFHAKIKPEVGESVYLSLAGPGARFEVGPDGDRRLVKPGRLMIATQPDGTRKLVPRVVEKVDEAAATKPLRDPANYKITKGPPMYVVTLDEKTGLPLTWSETVLGGTTIERQPVYRASDFLPVDGTTSVIPAKVVISAYTTGSPEVRVDVITILRTGVNAKVTFNGDSFDPAKLTRDSLSPKKAQK
ncbi:MAG TPA: hypothetical protein PKY77_05865 [Phycisphaerae bacterium]|nr:hypothetical protein [Phycisphaerae bacterium]HRY69029.1 hypothetical protein [Phycisphaerae bacterium]HSA25996.1 hypothetical protein [Phycisphaerae bacterium]